MLHVHSLMHFFVYWLRDDFNNVTAILFMPARSLVAEKLQRLKWIKLCQFAPIIYTYVPKLVLGFKQWLGVVGSNFCHFILLCYTRLLLAITNKVHWCCELQTCTYRGFFSKHAGAFCNTYLFKEINSSFPRCRNISKFWQLSYCQFANSPQTRN